MWAAQHPHTYLGARYRRIATRRGPMRANVAVQHSILVAIWHMASTGELYEDLGGDYYTRLNPKRTRTRAIRQLEAMGYQVTLDAAS
jgi:transposase